MAGRKEYSASLGATALLVTIAATLLLIFVLLATVFALVPPWNAANIAIAGSITFLICFLYLYVYMLRPMKYLVEDQNLIIFRRVKAVQISFAQIQDVFIVNKDTMADISRIGGNGGLFGFYGEFKTRFGRTTFYATRLDKFIMVKTKANELIVLTPDTLSMYYGLKEAIGAQSKSSTFEVRNGLD